MKSHYHNFNFAGKKDRTPARVKAVFLPLLLAIAIIALPIKRADAQSAPTLSYSSPQVYSPNAVITPLAPTSTGVAAPAYSTTPVTINTGLSSPFGVATDVAGNLYVSDLATQIVKEFPAGGGPAIIIGSGEFSHPEGITVDASGNVYAAGDYNGHVTEILKTDGSAVNSGTGFNEFSDVAVDAAGNIYVADFSNNNPVKEILKSNGNTVPIGTGFSNYCIAVAVDAAGNVYVADTHNAIKEILASNGNTIDLGSGFSNPQGVAVDAVGNVYVSDQGNGAIKEIPVGSSTPITLVSGLTNPGQIAVDGAGNVYFVDTTTGTVQEIKPVGGYYISAVPPGLSFSNSTGIIIGTASVKIPPTDYTITAYNSNGSASAVVNITVGTPPVPTISYQGPQTYTTGAAIFALRPSSAGVGAPGYSSTPAAAGTGYNQDVSVAIDAAGNVYVADKFNTAIKKIPAAGGSQVTIPTGYTGPGFYGIAIDPAGNFYLSDQSNNAVFKFPAGGGTLQQIGTGFNSPGGLAVDATGNVYVADIGNNAIKEILASNGNTVTLASGLGNGFAVAVDAAGNVYVAATFNNTVKKLPAGGGSPVNIGSGFSTPEGVAVDAVGNVYVSDFDSKSVKLISAANGNTSTLASGFKANGGLAVNGTGNVYVADPGKGTVYKISPNGGYYLNTALPAGLSFNGATGVISGTPLVVSPAKNYTITAYNVTGRVKATVNLGVVAPVTIKSIARQSAALTNTFYAGYTVVFGGAVTGLTPSNFSVTATNGITGTSVNSVTGSGNTYTVVAFTGTGDGTITLNMANDLDMQPGISTTLPFAGETYTIDKTPPTASPLTFSSNNANPAIANTNNTVSLVFGSSETIQAPVVTIAGHSVTAVSTGKNTFKASYTMTGDDTFGRVHFTLLMTDLAGNASSYDDVTAGDDVEFTSQTLSNAALSETLSTGSTITYLHNMNGVNYYTASVTQGTPSLTVKPIAADPAASITVDGQAVQSGTNSQLITLNSDTTTISLTVTAADGVTKHSFRILVSQNGSSDAAMTETLSTGSSITYVQNLDRVAYYTASVTQGTPSLTVKPTANDPTASITVDGQPVQSGTNSQLITLNSDTTTISLTITAADGVTRRSSRILVSQNGSSNAVLTETLSTGSGIAYLYNLDRVNYYTASVTAGTPSLTVKPTASDPTASITVDGQAVLSGTNSQLITLNSDTTTISLTITAADGVTRRSNRILITHAAATAHSDNNLSSINQSSIGLQTPGDEIKVHPALSPNGDGFNDVLLIDGITAYPDNMVKIMNPKGYVVYEAKGYDNVSKAFDGHSSKTGAMQRSGTYFYELTYKVKGDTKSKTGYIVLKY